MANLQVKDVPEALHRRLRKFAKQRNCTLGDVILSAIEHELARGEFKEKLSKRAPTSLGVTAADLLSDERTHRDSEWPQ